MKIIIQRVKQANVIVKEKEISKIDQGFLILVGIEKEDTKEDVKYLAKKTVNLRIFEDENGKMNKSIKDINGQILAISNFTLCANTSSGNRPSFTDAMESIKANELYELFCSLVSDTVPCKKGIFGANMQVSLINDRPVTITLSSK